MLTRMLELSKKGYYCAQILLILALEAEGKEDADLVRAMGGLCGGLGNGGKLCGALTGGACFLSYFAGKGEDDEIAHADCDAMIQALTAWFTQYCAPYGGTDCADILEGDSRNKIQRCPLLLQGVLENCIGLLEERGLL